MLPISDEPPADPRAIRAHVLYTGLAFPAIRRMVVTRPPPPG